MNITYIKPQIGFKANYYENNNNRYCELEIQTNFHLRPCTEIAKLANTLPFEDCFIKVANRNYSTKSPIGIMCAGLKKGTKALLVASMDYPKDLFMKIADCFEQKEG